LPSKNGEDTPSRQKKKFIFFVLRSTFRIFANKNYKNIITTKQKQSEEWKKK